jgi:tetratricopeptide (TPR) repeat protein
MSEPEHDGDERINDLLHALDESYERCRMVASARIAAELQRWARAERRVTPYICSLFFQANLGWSTLDPERAREAAVELIAVLESEERARQIQADFAESEYEQAKFQYSTCAYDNLAKAIALSHGYNSEGLHQAIGEGLEICRRTGKTECIPCFREYAADVHRAADDLEMALHHARTVANVSADRPGAHRRWSGAYSEADLLLIAGQLEAAEAAARRALDLAPTFPSVLDAQLRSLPILRTILLLRGQDDSVEVAGNRAAGDRPPLGEWPQLDLDDDLVEALRLVLSGDYDAALDRLATWDARLLQRQCLDLWFEVRLRQIAAQRLAGRSARAEALAKPLEAKARQARDWMTLRRLAIALDPTFSPAPYPAAMPLGHSPTTVMIPAPEASTTDDSPAEKTSAPTTVTTPLDEALCRLYERLTAAGEDEAARSAVLDDVLSYRSEMVTHPLDAIRLLALARRAAMADRTEEIWAWAEPLAAPFPNVAWVLNLLAALGDTLRNAKEEALGQRITSERLEGLFRRSLELDPNDASNFARAAAFFLSTEQMGEAEHCLARASRLDRSDGWVALRLASIYSQTDRARDALVILDLCLREGNTQPEVAWQAALTAHTLGQHEAMLTYLDRFETLEPGRPWVHYYRALGMLDLGRPEEALRAIATERHRFEGSSLHLDILQSCAVAALGRLDEVRDLLRRILATHLADINYLTYNGFVQLFERLWTAASPLPEDDPLRRALEERLLVTGLAPNALFEAPRKSHPKREGLNFYRCTLLQPLGDSWRDAPGCLPGQEDWKRYRIDWGVLATDEDEAARLALAWQARCEARPASVEEVELQDDGYADHPGVVWQGYRAGETT